MSGGAVMSTITDEYMRQMISQSATFSLVLLKAGPRRNEPGVEPIVWEHGRRNFELRAEGILPIVCPIVGKSELRGIGIFNATQDEVRKIMDDDPGVKTGVFVYEIYPCRGFPGDALPKK